MGFLHYIQFWSHCQQFVICISVQKFCLKSHVYTAWESCWQRWRSPSVSKREGEEFARLCWLRAVATRRDPLSPSPTPTPSPPSFKGHSLFLVLCLDHWNGGDWQWLAVGKGLRCLFLSSCYITRLCTAINALKQRRFLIKYIIQASQIRVAVTEFYPPWPCPLSTPLQGWISELSV